MKKLLLIPVAICIIGLLVYFYSQQPATSTTEVGDDSGTTQPEASSQPTAPSTLRPLQPKPIEPGTEVDPIPRPANAEQATVAYVHDGDTLYLQPPGTSSRADELTVRLIGLDTPEINPTVECFGLEARDYLRSVLPVGSTVWYTYDEGHFDKYDRNLMYLWTASGEFVNLDLVEEGYATALRIAPNDYYWPQLREAEKLAQQSNRGMWGKC
ncbi:MAG: thermonuclease family protein [Cryobacterium sp.]|nr:thermonuclease family protein [Cryobacterium sp.]MCO5294864.1 thermonuclease family protein [Homoserinimonas sp.]MCW5945102.1 thermonuclease family protein [Cryobacterium sp.]